VRPRLERASARPALAEGLQGRQALHRVEEVGAEGPVGSIASEAGLAVPAVPEGGRQQYGERRHQQHERHRQIHEGDEREDEERREGGHEELGQVLAEVHLELLHAFHEREHDVAGAGPGEVRGTERRHLRIEHLAQSLLHARRRVMRHHRARVVERAPPRERQRRERDGRSEIRQRVADQDAPQEPSQEREPRDPGDDRGEADENGEGDPTAHTRGECPESRLEVHAG
jgi:hypothetical protein